MNKLELLGKEGVISNYKQGRHTLHPKHCILIFADVKTRKEANKLVGRTVVWNSPSGKAMRGKITRAVKLKGKTKYEQLGYARWSKKA